MPETNNGKKETTEREDAISSDGASPERAEISRLDYFASHALTGLIAGAGTREMQLSPMVIARKAYTYGQAMEKASAEAKGEPVPEPLDLNAELDEIAG